MSSLQARVITINIVDYIIEGLTDKCMQVDGRRCVHLYCHEIYHPEIQHSSV